MDFKKVMRERLKSDHRAQMACLHRNLDGSPAWMVTQHLPDPITGKPKYSCMCGVCLQTLEGETVREATREVPFFPKMAQISIVMRD